MRVRMKVGMTGTRNGQEWPPRGGEIDLPDAEAEQMINSGMAEALNSFEAPTRHAEARSALVPKRSMRLQ